MTKLIAWGLSLAMSLGSLSALTTVPALAAGPELVNLALNKSGSGYPEAFTDYAWTSDPITNMNDGIISAAEGGNFNDGPRSKWSTWDKRSQVGHAGVTFECEQEVHKVEWYHCIDTANCPAPKSLSLEYWDGEAWQPITAEITEKAYEGEYAIGYQARVQQYTFTFDAVETSKIQMVVTPQDNMCIAATEIEVYGVPRILYGFNVKLGTAASETTMPGSVTVDAQAAERTLYLKLVDSKGNEDEQTVAIPANQTDVAFELNLDKLVTGGVAVTASLNSDYSESKEYTFMKRIPNSVIDELYNEVKTPYEYGIVLSYSGVAGDFDSNLIDNPNVFTVPGDDEYAYMTYVGHDGTGYRTGLARSKDMLNWEKVGKILENGAEGAWDEFNAAGYIVRDHVWGEMPTPHIMKDGRYAMTYLASDTAGYEAGIKRAGVAFSDKIFNDDGTVAQWTRHPDPVLDAHDGAYPYEKGTIWKLQAIWDDDTQKYYGFYNAAGGPEVMCGAVSGDLINWTRMANNPLLTVDNSPAGAQWGGSHNADADVVKIGDYWVMFYFTSSPGGIIDSFAVSQDLINWQKSYLPLTTRNGSYSSTYAHKPCVVKKNGVVYHYYNAVGSAGRLIAVDTSVDLSVLRKAQELEPGSCSEALYQNLQTKIAAVQAELYKDGGSLEAIEAALAELTAAYDDCKVVINDPEGLDNLALNTTGVEYPKVFAGHTNGAESPSYMVDDIISGKEGGNHDEGPRNRWTNWGQNVGKTEYIGSEFGSMKEVEAVNLYAFNDGSDVPAPKSVAVEYRDTEGNWQPVANAVTKSVIYDNDGKVKLFGITFDKIGTDAVRLALEPAGADKSVGVTEMKIFGSVYVPMDELTNLALNKSGSGYPEVFAGYTNGGDSLASLNDGVVSGRHGSPHDDGPRNRWTNYNHTGVEYAGVKFESEQDVYMVEWYAYNDGGGVPTPKSVGVEYWDGEAWLPIATSTTGTPYENEYDEGRIILYTFKFEPVSTSQIRMKLEPQDGKSVGASELRVWGKANMLYGFSAKVDTVVPDDGQIPVLLTAEAADQARTMYYKAEGDKGGLINGSVEIPAGETSASFSVDATELSVGKIKLSLSFKEDFSEVKEYTLSKELPSSVINELYEEIKTPYSYGVVLRYSGVSGTYDSDLVDNANVFRMPGDDEYVYMTFVGHDGTGYRTGLARSKDMFNWEKMGLVLDNGTSGAWDEYNAAGYIVRDHVWGEIPTPHVMADGRYAMTYLASDTPGYEAGNKLEGVAFTDKIFNEDGSVAQWTRHPDPILPAVEPYEGGIIWKMQAFWDDETQKYYGFYNAASPEVMCGATSDDLINWTRMENNPLLVGSKAPDGGDWGGHQNADADVVKIGDYWVMTYFTGTPYGIIDSFAVSTDLYNWQKSYLPLTDRDDGYNSTYAHKPCILKKNGVVYHYYCAVGNEGRVIAVDTSIDLSILQKALAINEADCTPEQYARLQKAIGMLQAELIKDGGSLAEVEAAKEALAAAVEGRDEPSDVDKSFLEALITAVANYDETRYTTESWAAFDEALTAANGVVADDAATQADVFEAYLNLVKARDGLTYAVKTDLLELAVELAQGVLDGDEDLKQESIDRLNAVIAEANELLAKEDATQDEINAMYNKVMNTIVTVAERVNREMLTNQIAAAEALAEGQYTPNSWKELQDELVLAKAVEADDDATAEEIKAAYDALTKKITDLVFRANFAVLESAISLAEQILADDRYDEAALADVQKILDEAKVMLEEQNATQAEVKAKATELTTAIAKVRLKKEIAEVQAQIEEKDLSKYTTASVKALNAAMKSANDLLKADEVNEVDVDEAKASMLKALNGLEMKSSKPSKGSTSQVSDSDYWAEVIEKINATEKGGKVNAKLDEGGMVPATVIDAAKDKGVIVVFEIGGVDYAVNGAGELKGYSAAAVYYTSAEIKAMAGNAPAASGTTTANSNPETGGEVSVVIPAEPEATVPMEPVVPEAPAVIEPVVPAEPEAPAAQAEVAEAGLSIWVIVAIVIAAAAVIGGATLIVVRRKHEN